MTATAFDDFEYEFEMPLSVVSGIYAGMGWVMDVPNEGLRSPDEETIQSFLEGMVESLASSEEFNYTTLIRMMVIRDSEFPDGFDFYFKIGHCRPKIPAAVR